MNRPTEFGTVAGMTGLIGILPLLVTLCIAESVPSLNALILTGLHLLFMAAGAWIFALWFGD